MMANTLLHRGMNSIPFSSTANFQPAYVIPQAQAHSHHQEFVEQHPAVVAIVTTNALISEGLSHYLMDSSFKAVVVRSSCKELSTALSAVQARVVVLAVSTHSIECFEALSLLRQHQPELLVLVIADYTMPSLVKLLFKSGANGYLLSMPSQSSMLTALEMLVNDMYVLDKQLAYIQPLLAQTLQRSCGMV